MRKLPLILIAIVLSFGVVYSSQALVDNNIDGPGGGEPGGGGDPTPSCSINLNFNPNNVVQGGSYTRSWSSDNVEGTLTGYCSDISGSIPGLPANFQDSSPLTAEQNVSCYLKGETSTGQTCTSNTAVLTVQPPTCNASINWNKNSVESGGSADVSWNVSSNDPEDLSVQVECTGVASVNDAANTGTKSFSNIQTNSTCTVKGFVNNVQKCDASDTLTVTAPPNTQTAGKITVVAPSGVSWFISGTKSYEGSGSKTFFDAPNGDYTLQITESLGGKVVSSISPQSTQKIDGVGLNPPPNSDPVPPIGYPKPGERIQIEALKNGASKLFAMLVKKSGAATTEITFNVETRNAAQKINLSYSPMEIVDYAENVSISADSNDYYNAGKSVNLYKAFRRLSNNQTGNRYTPGWRGLVSDSNGNLDLLAHFKCEGGDSDIFADSDYEDTSYLVFDQGDGQGDSSNAVVVKKLCGASVKIVSVDTNGNPVSASWNLASSYATQSGNGSQLIRSDRGTNTITASASGYRLVKVGPEPLPQPSGRRRSSGGYGETYYAKCDSLPCAGVLWSPDDMLVFHMIWEPWTGEPREIPSCTADRSPVQINQNVKFTGIDGTGSYSWKDSDNHTGTGKEFTTSYTTAGNKIMTVTSGTRSNTCSVNVTTIGDPISVDLKVNGSNTPSSVPINTPFTVSWTSSGATSCTASGGWNGNGSVAPVASGNVSESESTAGQYSYQISCQNSSGNTATDVVPLTVTGPQPPTVDLKVGGVDGEYTVQNGGSAMLTWEVENANACTASGPTNWAGSKSVSGGSQSTGALTKPPETRTYTITCTGDIGPDASDTVSVKITDTQNPLNVSLTATPSSGKGSFTSSLKAVANGGNSGSYNFYFWWDCSSAANTLDGAKSACGNEDSRVLNSNSNEATINHGYSLRSGQTSSSYSPKVVVVRGSQSAEDRDGVSVSSDGCTSNCGGDGLNVNLTAVPNSGPSGFKARLKADVSNESGNITYYFWKNCTNTTNVYNEAVSACGTPFETQTNKTETSWTTQEVTYSSNSTPKVIAIRNSKNGQDTDSVTISTTGGYTCQNYTCAWDPAASGDANGCNVSNRGSSCDSGGAGSCTFEASPKIIQNGGNSSLRWSCEVPSCSIVGLGPLTGTSGTIPVLGLTQTKTYNLVCGREAGGSALVDLKATVRVMGLGEEIPR